MQKNSYTVEPKGQTNILIGGIYFTQHSWSALRTCLVNWSLSLTGEDEEDVLLLFSGQVLYVAAGTPGCCHIPISVTYGEMEGREEREEGKYTGESIGYTCILGVCVGVCVCVWLGDSTE